MDPAPVPSSPAGGTPASSEPRTSPAVPPASSRPTFGSVAASEASALAHDVVRTVEGQVDPRAARTSVAGAVGLAIASLVAVALIPPSAGRSVLSLLAVALLGASLLLGSAFALVRWPLARSGRARAPHHAGARRAVAGGALTVSFGLGALLTLGLGRCAPEADPLSTETTAVLGAPSGGPIIEPAGSPASARAGGAARPGPVPGVGAGGASGGTFVRHGRDTVGPGQLYVPESFAPAGASFDVLIHFHGHADVVVESAARARLNAVVVVVNMKKGSKYHDHFRDPAALASLLDQARTQMEKRGLSGAEVRRVALSSFGSGSGALTTILNAPAGAERADAALIFDGLHVRWVDEEKRERVDPNEISPLVRFAEAARDGKKLLGITHSGPKGAEHADARAVADAILEATGVAREAHLESPDAVDLEGGGKLFHDGKVQRLEPESRAHKGGLHVLGYANRAAGHQPAHLVQMSVTLLPLLVERWAKAGGG